MESNINELVGLLLPIVLTFANRYVYQGIEKLTVVMAGFPPLAKQVSVVVASFALTKTAVWLGMSLPGDLSGLTPEVTLAILTALAAMGMHELKKKEA